MSQVVRLSEEQVEAGQDMARAELLRRYELVWGTVAPHVDGTLEADGFRPDPRMVAVGVSVLEKLWRLWRLDRPSEGRPVAGVVDARGLVLSRLREIEGRG